ncbi:MAG: hypothetical protein E6Q98_15710 [Rhodospirillaceae bacterium]|nr:MAG: hypothetical protein E6Q98_15710 [Rhodospirillaceae bacterium]
MTKADRARIARIMSTCPPQMNDDVLWMVDRLQAAEQNRRPGLVWQQWATRIRSWVLTSVGREAFESRQERAARVLEEAIELAQAEDLPQPQATALVRHVYSKPIGDPVQETAGIGVTLIAYAAAAGISLPVVIARELARIEALPADHFRKRQQAKADAGVAMPPARVERAMTAAR